VGQVPDGHLLLVIDQLEEIFDTPADSDARAMLRFLLETSVDRDSPLLTLATMRSDFMNILAQDLGYVCGHSLVAGKTGNSAEEKQHMGRVT
jgi:hypothetical protein